MTENLLQLEMHTEQPLIERAVPSQRMLEISVTPPPAVARQVRASLNLAIVLDRSGSMSGDKLRYVQQAAQKLIDLLEEQDRVAVVAFDDEVTVVAESTLITPESRRSLKQRIGEIRSGGQTNLSEGWLTGCKQAVAQQKAGLLSRALLLTDGQANAGIQDLEELAVHARQLNSLGVSTSTFGVGEGYNEHLLEAMANAGGGHFYYIERPEDSARLFSQEFQELAAVTAREVEVVLAVPDSVAVQVLGGWPTETVDEYLHISLGALQAGRPELVYISLLLPPAKDLAQLTIKGRVLGRGVEGQAYESAAELSFVAASPAAVRAAPLETELLARSAQVRVAEAVNLSLKLERAGERDKAHRGLRQTLEACRTYLKAEDVERYQELAERMQRGMEEYDRKSSHQQAYQARKNRL